MRLYKKPLHIKRKCFAVFGGNFDLYGAQDNYESNNAQYYVESCQANTSASFIHIFELVGIDIKFIEIEVLAVLGLRLSRLCGFFGRNLKGLCLFLFGLLLLFLSLGKLRQLGERFNAEAL